MDLEQLERTSKTPVGDLSLIEMAAILRRRRRLLSVFVLGLPFITAVIMVLTPNRYTSTGSVLVETPEGVGIGAEFAGQLRSLTGFAAQVPPTEMYMAILRSERVKTAVAESLGLAVHYEIEGDSPGEILEKTLERMDKRVEFESPDMISIQIRSTDRDPQMAADITNRFLSTLEIVNQALTLSRASRDPSLVAQALHDGEAERDSSLRAMQKFQESNGLFSIEKQTEGTLELIATLQTQLLAARTERKALEGFTSESSSSVRKLELEIDALESQIQELVGEIPDETLGTAVSETTDARKESFFIPLTRLPELANEYTRLLMEVRVHEEKYAILATQLEQAEIDESQSIPSFQILDWGRRPFRKSGPRWTLTVLAALVGGTLAGVLLAIFLDDINRRVDASTRRELRRLLPFSRGRKPKDTVRA